MDGRGKRQPERRLGNQEIAAVGQRPDDRGRCERGEQTADALGDGIEVTLDRLCPATCECDYHGAWTLPGRHTRTRLLELNAWSVLLPLGAAQAGSQERAHLGAERWKRPR